MNNHQFIDNPEFVKARKELEDALTKYTATCEKLKAGGDKFAGTDNKIGLRFRAIDGAQKEASIFLTDC